MADSREPVTESGDWEMVTTERALVIGWELAHGLVLTPMALSQRFGVDRSTAWRILIAAERVLRVVATVAMDCPPSNGFDRLEWRKLD